MKKGIKYLLSFLVALLILTGCNNAPKNDPKTPNVTQPDKPKHADGCAVKIRKE